MFRFRKSVAEFLRRLDPRSCEGIAAVELALVAPVLVAVLVGIWDFGRFTYENARLTSAAGAGAQFLFHVGKEVDITDPVTLAAIKQAVRADALDFDGKLEITPNQFCECPGNVPVACTQTCGNPPEPPAMFIAVDVKGNVMLMFDYNFAQNPTPITKRNVVRVQ